MSTCCAHIHTGERQMCPSWVYIQKYYGRFVCYTSAGTAKVCDCTEWPGVCVRIWEGNADGRHQEKSGARKNCLNVLVQVQYTKPRPVQLRTLYHRTSYIHSTLTAPETQEEVRSQCEGALQQLVEQLIQMLKRDVREHTQGKIHKTFHVVGNNKVGTDSLSPYIHGFLGCDLWNPPKVSIFHGEEAPGKNEVSFEQCLFETTKTEWTLNQIQLKYPGRLDSAAVEGHLEEQLFHGMSKGIRDSLHYLYDNPSVSYTQLVAVALKKESEQSEAKKVWCKTAKVGTEENNSALAALTEQVTYLMDNAEIKEQFLG